MTSLETIKAKISEINAKKQELIADLRKDFAPMLKPLFEKSNGKISSFGWTQYTPHWNDGDECTFRVNIGYPMINGVDYDEHDSLEEEKYVTITAENEKEVKEYLELKGYKWMMNNTIGQGGYIKNKKYDSKLIELTEEFKSVLSNIDSEFLKDLFGDHVLVTVHDNGTIETEEYEHD